MSGQCFLSFWSNQSACLLLVLFLSFSDLVTCLPELVFLGSKTVACGANSHTKIFIAKNIDMSPEQGLQSLGDALRCHCTVVRCTLNLYMMLMGGQGVATWHEWVHMPAGIALGWMTPQKFYI